MSIFGILEKYIAAIITTIIIKEVLKIQLDFPSGPQCVRVDGAD